jgi:pSer/pThr/pTyr-binding forkhead associated (FHA) protein
MTSGHAARIAPLARWAEEDMTMASAAEPFKSASSQALRIDELCDQFEAAVQAGKKPQIYEYLQRIADDQRSALLTELTLLDSEYQQKLGERLAVEIHEPRQAGHVGDIESTIDQVVTAKAGDPPSAVTAVVLSVLNGPSQGQRVTLETNGVYLAGRGPEAQLPLPPSDKSISQAHFQIEIALPRCSLTNLSKTNGTFLNGEQVTVTELRHGDIILAGDTALRVAIELRPVFS